MQCSRMLERLVRCGFALENSLGPGIVPPVAARIAALNVDPFFVPLHPCPDAGRTVSQSQPTAASWR